MFTFHDFFWVMLFVILFVTILVIPLYNRYRKNYNRKINRMVSDFNKNGVQTIERQATIIGNINKEINDLIVSLVSVDIDCEYYDITDELLIELISTKNKIEAIKGVKK